MVLANATLGSVPNPVHNLLSLVFERFPDKVSTRKVLGSITRNLNVDLAGDQHLRANILHLFTTSRSLSSDVSEHARQT